MISKDELVRNVAETCGISLENSSLFFDVFVNRVSNRLKPGEIINFNNFGYFQKRQCRIQLEKTLNSPTAKSYLIHLVIFSLNPKVNDDLTDVHFLRIPNLKTLWLDDEDFLKSLKAGDFAPYSERNQLIKAFATKAEVILANQRKDYDGHSESELIIPLTFDLNFLIRTGHKQTVPEFKQNGTELSKGNKLPVENEKIALKNNDDFPNKNKKDTSQKDLENIPFKDIKQTTSTKDPNKDELEKNIKFGEELAKKVSEDDLQKRLRNNEKVTKPTDFESVSSQLPGDNEEKELKRDYDTVKFSFGNRQFNTEDKINDRFTEVKSKTEAYNLKDDLSKGKKKSREDSYRSYSGRRNYLPLIIAIAFIIISVLAVYFYFFSGKSTGSKTANLTYEVKPPADTNVIERDYEFAVTYPYTKSETPNQVEGYNQKIFDTEKQKTALSNTENKKEKTETALKEKTENQKVVAEEKPLTVIEQEKTNQPETKEETNVNEQQNNRIFLYRGFYVVYVGSFKTEDEVNREADKYSNLGYNPIIETAGSRGKGSSGAFKLNVGDFTSVDFAKQFVSKYLK